MGKIDSKTLSAYVILGLFAVDAVAFILASMNGWKYPFMACVIVNVVCIVAINLAGIVYFLVRK